MRRFLIPVVLAVVAAASMSAQAPTPTLPQLFQKAKEQVKFGSWKEALTTLQEIDTLAQQPGLEKDRAALAPAVAFYRGVCEASLDRPDEAKKQFALFLKEKPDAGMDPAAYPKKAVAAFEEARKGMVPAANPTSTTKDSSRIAAAYRAFHAQPGVSREDTGEDWGNGPVRFLMTAEEKQEYSRLTDSISRAEFIEKFWMSRDPKAETPENEFRHEFERRVAFADQAFIQGEQRGSFTDRGMVFVLLGPPTYSGAGPMKTGEDKSDPSAMFQTTAGDAQEAGQVQGRSVSARGAAILKADAATGTGNAAATNTTNWRETWRYMRADLPTALPYTSVDFEFITRPGYGEGILQKDPPALNALDRAKMGLGKPKS